MRQMMVIEVSMHDTKSRTKAMTVAAGFSGVLSVALQGEDLRQLEVTGDGIDAVTLTTLLRKNVGHAQLVSVSPVTEGGGDQSNEEDREPENNESTAEPELIWCPCNGHGVPHYRNNYDDYNDHPGPGCPVM